MTFRATRSRWWLSAPLVVVVAGLAPLVGAGGASQPRSDDVLPAPYWGRVIHVVAPGEDGSELLAVTAFSFLGFEAGTEALPPGGAIDPGGEVSVTETRCASGRCRDEVRRAVITPASVTTTGDLTTLNADVEGCKVRMTWTATARSGPPPDTVDGAVVPSWYRDPRYWRAVASGTVCGVPVDSDQAFVA